MRNLHKAYYKDYFKNLNFGYLLNNGVEPKTEIKRRNGELTAPNLLQRIPKSSIVNQTIELQISYPGLVTGIGINHEATIEGEFKLGVHFDWTYGMPIVYGSSVKGVLRAFFLDFYKGDIDHGDLMMNIFSGVYNRDIKAEKKKYGDNWEKIIKDPEKRIYKDCLSIYNRDIFFDAIITNADSKGRILCSDSITFHPDPLKNPNPITFLKIASGCTLEFRFKLEDSVVDGKPFKKEDKIKLFKEILTTVGVGAKTNVGYGQLKSVDKQTK